MSKQFYLKKFSLTLVRCLVLGRALSGATTPGQSGPGSDGNEVMLRIPQSSSITGTSPLDCHMQDTGCGVLLVCIGAIGVFYW